MCIKWCGEKKLDSLVLVVDVGWVPDQAQRTTFNQAAVRTPRQVDHKSAYRALPGISDQLSLSGERPQPPLWSCGV